MPPSSSPCCRHGRTLLLVGVVNAVLLAVVLVLLVVPIVQGWLQKYRQEQNRLRIARTLNGGMAGQAGQAGQGTCSSATCAATDPVSEPAYNMKEIAKQSILLEEHLTVAAKYCEDCCVKHLLHCQGLAAEAVMLACDRVDRYPMMRESPAFFQRLLDDWPRKKDVLSERLGMAASLREYRKALVKAYF